MFWPRNQAGSKVYHLSTVAAAEMLYVDNTHNGVPFETASNHEIMATRQYFGEGVNNPGYDDQQANELNETGITTMVFIEGTWNLWGGMTAAYKYGTEMDGAVVFDSSMRMLMYVSNGFQKRHFKEINAPLTLARKESIRLDEQEVLDGLMNDGALLPGATCEFMDTENSINDMVNGDFVWHNFVTPTPQLKSATGKVTYTDDGFQSLYGEEG